MGPPPDQRPSRRRRLLIGALGILVLAIVCIFGIPWILESLNSVSTDDAYVHGHATFVAPRVAGQISPVLVDDNNCVHKGELLAELDKEPFPDAVAFYGGLRSLWASIHVAGGFAFAPLTDTTAELRRLIDDNLVSCFLCCREAVAAMRRGKVDGRPGGRIVNVAARQALEPREGAKMSADTAAKPGVAALSAALDEELGGGYPGERPGALHHGYPHQPARHAEGQFRCLAQGGGGGGDDPLPRLAREQGDSGRRGPGLRGFLPVPAEPAERDDHVLKVHAPRTAQAKEAMRIMREDYDKTSLASRQPGSEVWHHPAFASTPARRPR